MVQQSNWTAKATPFINLLAISRRIKPSSSIPSHSVYGIALTGWTGRFFRKTIVLFFENRHHHHHHTTLLPSVVYRTVFLIISSARATSLVLLDRRTTAKASHAGVRAGEAARTTNETAAGPGWVQDRMDIKNSHTHMSFPHILTLALARKGTKNEKKNALGFRFQRVFFYSCCPLLAYKSVNVCAAHVFLRRRRRLSCALSPIRHRPLALAALLLLADGTTDGMLRIHSLLRPSSDRYHPSSDAGQRVGRTCRCSTKVLKKQ